MKTRYWFSLHDPATGKIVGDPQWLSKPEAREAVIRQSMSEGQYNVRRFEDEIPDLNEPPSPR